MGDAPTSLAMNGAQSLVSPDVLGGGFWVTLDLNRAELKVNPRSADAAAQRAVAIGRYFGCGWQGHSNRATVARALMHAYSVGRIVPNSVRRMRAS